MDPRVKKLARVLVKYCAEVKKNEIVKILGSQQAMPLIIELYAQSLALGAHPYTRIVVDELDEIFLKDASPGQLMFISPMARYEIEKIDVTIGILSPSNTKMLSRINPSRLASARQAQGKIMRRFSERAAKGELSWVVTQFPTNAAAQDAEMSLADYEDFVYSACMLDRQDPITDWQKISKYNRRLINFLKRKSTIRIVASGTDLTFNVAGRKWINCDGKNNFPDGEVFTGPVENSVNGQIRFTYPAVYYGREVCEVGLEFKNGRVAKASALRGEDFLNAMIRMDKGSAWIGEVAIGTNHGIKAFTRNILYDEKIGGTFHMALGNGYPESGSKNRSALHWDMICDLRDNGAMYADGQLFLKNGKFLR